MLAWICICAVLLSTTTALITAQVVDDPDLPGFTPHLENMTECSLVIPMDLLLQGDGCNCYSNNTADFNGVSRNDFNLRAYALWNLCRSLVDHHPLLAPPPEVAIEESLFWNSSWTSLIWDNLGMVLWIIYFGIIFLSNGSSRRGRITTILTSALLSGKSFHKTLHCRIQNMWPLPVVLSLSQFVGQKWLSYASYSVLFSLIISFFSQSLRSLFMRRLRAVQSRSSSLRKRLKSTFGIFWSAVGPPRPATEPLPDDPPLCCGPRFVREEFHFGQRAESGRVYWGWTLQNYDQDGSDLVVR